MNHPARCAILMQVNIIILIFQKSFLRSREANGLDKPLSCSVNTGLHELEIYSWHWWLITSSNSVTCLLLVWALYTERLDIYTVQSTHFFILMCTQPWVLTWTKSYQQRFSFGSAQWWPGVVIEMHIPQPHPRPTETESLGVGLRYLNFNKEKQSQYCP